MDSILMDLLFKERLYAMNLAEIWAKFNGLLIVAVLLRIMYLVVKKGDGHLT